MAHVLRHGQDRLAPVQRLADDAREEAGRRSVRPPGTDADRRQADPDPVEEIPAASSRPGAALRSPSACRSSSEASWPVLIADRVGERGAEHRDRRREDEPRPVAVGPSARIASSRSAHAVQVDAVALLEVRLRLAGDHGGQVEDERRVCAATTSSATPGFEMSATSVSTATPASNRRLRRHRIDERDVLDQATSRGCRRRRGVPRACGPTMPAPPRIRIRTACTIKLQRALDQQIGRRHRSAFSWLLRACRPR